MKQKPVIGAVVTFMAMAYLISAEADSLSGAERSLILMKSNDIVVDSSALILGEEAYGKMLYGRSINGVSFQQDAVVTHNGFQYVGFYDASRQVCIARRKLPAGEWETIRFGDHTFKLNNAHNTISIGISPNNGTIHLAFDHHASKLNYRVSKKGVATDPEAVDWEPSLFGPISSLLGEEKLPSVTYPRFIQTPEGRHRKVASY